MAHLGPRKDESEVDAVINGVDAAERDVRARVRALLEGRWEQPVHVLTKGLNLEGEEKERVETELRQIVAEELLEDLPAQGEQRESEELPPPEGSLKSLDRAQTEALRADEMGPSIARSNSTMPPRNKAVKGGLPLFTGCLEEVFSETPYAHSSLSDFSECPEQATVRRRIPYYGNMLRGEC